MPRYLNLARPDYLIGHSIGSGNIIERLFGWIKQNRTIGTRYDERG
jgi:hypothetical protein